VRNPDGLFLPPLRYSAGIHALKTALFNIAAGLRENHSEEWWKILSDSTYPKARTTDEMIVAVSHNAQPEQAVDHPHVV
jgi:hypothetical protein